MNRIAVLLIASIVGGSSLAHAQWFEAGEAVADTAWRKSAEGFGAMILLTSSPETFLAAWAEPSSPDYAPAIETTDHVARGVPIHAYVFFTGCTPDRQGSCDATTDFVVLRPDGSEYANIPGVELWQGKPPPEEGSVQLGPASVGVVIEPQDPLGEYTVKARVCDRLADNCLVIWQRFTAEEAPGGTP